MQCSELLFTFLTLVAELEYDHSQAYVFAQVIITPSPYSQFYDPEGHISCGYLLAFQEACVLLVRLLLARLIRDTCMLLNESMKPRCVRFQGY
jgi:hypothetical protein